MAYDGDRQRSELSDSFHGLAAHDGRDDVRVDGELPPVPEPETWLAWETCPLEEPEEWEECEL